jgi:hypothetical protein
VSIHALASVQQQHQIKKYIKVDVYEFNEDPLETLHKLYNSDLLIIGGELFPKAAALLSPCKLIYIPYYDGKRVPERRTQCKYHWGRSLEFIREGDWVMTDESCFLNKSELYTLIRTLYDR